MQQQTTLLVVCCCTVFRQSLIPQNMNITNAQLAFGLAMIVLSACKKKNSPQRRRDSQNSDTWVARSMFRSQPLVGRSTFHFLPRLMSSRATFRTDGWELLWRARCDRKYLLRTPQNGSCHTLWEFDFLFPCQAIPRSYHKTDDYHPCRSRFKR